jgi:hypothetical protein
VVSTSLMPRFTMITIDAQSVRPHVLSDRFW